MKIKSIMIAMLAMVSSMSFVACSKDDTSSNEEHFQAIVDQEVKTNKKHDKAILVVAFGSTWQQSFDTFDTVLAEYKAEFGKDWDVYLAFSSAICSNQANAWEHKDEGAEKRDYFAPEYWLTAIGKMAYKQVVVQSLQVIPGEEYARVCDVYVKDFLNNKYRLFTEDYMHSLDKRVAIGTSLMDSEEDVEALAEVLSKESDVKSVIDNGGTVVFMGHGNPEERYGHGNSRYWQLEEALQNITPGKFFVGTVDDEGTVKEYDYAPNLAEDVLDRMDGIVAKDKMVQLYPLMSISGDHAHNDLSADDDKDSWINLFKAEGYEKAQAYETNFAEPCWKSYKKGNEGKEYIPALAERKAVRNLWMEHTRIAIELSNNKMGISTPTTAVEEEE